MEDGLFIAVTVQDLDVRYLGVTVTPALGFFFLLGLFLGFFLFVLLLAGPVFFLLLVTKTCHIIHVVEMDLPRDSVCYDLAVIDPYGPVAECLDLIERM